MFYYSKCNPVTEFLQTRKRGGLDNPLVLATLVLAALVLADSLSWGWILLCPLYLSLRLSADRKAAAFLFGESSWQEVILTRLHPLEMLDGVTYQGLRSALPAALLLLIAWISSAGRPGHGAYLASLLLLPLALWIASYLNLLSFVAARRGARIRGQARLVAALGTLLLGLSCCWRDWWAGGLTLALASLFLMGLAFRHMAADSLDSFQEVSGAAPELPKVGTNPCLRPWNDNPIVVLECRREARLFPGGLGQALMHRYGVGLLILAALASILLRDGRLGEVAAWKAQFGLWMLLVLQPCRVGARIPPVLFPCRSVLIQTRLTTAEWLDGWAQVAVRGRLIENTLVAAGLVVLTCLLQGLHPGTGGLWEIGRLYLYLQCLTLVAAYLRLALLSLKPYRWISACAMLGGIAILLWGSFPPPMLIMLVTFVLRKFAIKSLEESK